MNSNKLISYGTIYEPYVSIFVFSLHFWKLLVNKIMCNPVYKFSTCLDWPVVTALSLYGDISCKMFFCRSELDFILTKLCRGHCM